MFSGLVLRAWFSSTGILTGTVYVTTGIVIRKMIRSTSITSTSGVVLIVETTSSSSLSEPTFIAMAASARWASARRRRAHAGTHQHAVQVGAEAAHRLHRYLVAAHQPVVAEHRGHGDEQAEGGHDQRLAHRAGDLVDRRLAGDADRRQRVVDAPDRAEQADEGRRRADGSQEGEAVLEAALHVVECTLDLHRDPGVVVDVLGQGALVVLAGLEPGVGDEAERRAFLQAVGGLADALRLEELARHLLGLARHL